jgi:hypothetical protein
MLRKANFLSKPKKKKNVLRKYLPYFNQEIFGGLCLFLPIYLASEANISEHWTSSSKRHKNQKDWVRLALADHKIRLPCHVKLTRLAPGTLDVDDNLPMSFKYLKDYIASEITGDYRPGRADADKRIKWSYDQTKSSLYGAKVLILFERSDSLLSSQSVLEV